MPQWRRLYTKIVESEDFNAMPNDFTRLLWALLPLWLDGKGRALDKATMCRARLFPLREDVELGAIDAAMNWFAQRGMIIRYEVEGRRYFYVPTFSIYQGDGHSEAASLYPAPPEQDDSEQESTPELVQTYSEPTPELVASSSALDIDVDIEVDVEEDVEEDASELASGVPLAAGVPPANLVESASGGAVPSLVEEEEPAARGETETPPPKPAAPPSPSPEEFVLKRKPGRPRRERQEELALKAEEVLSPTAEGKIVYAALEQHFIAQTHLTRPMTRNKAQWASYTLLWHSPLKEIAALCGDDVGKGKSVITAALAKLGEDMTIASPKSILNTARAVVAQNGNGHGQASNRIRIDAPVGERIIIR